MNEIHVIWALLTVGIVGAILKGANDASEDGISTAHGTTITASAALPPGLVLTWSNSPSREMVLLSFLAGVTLALLYTFKTVSGGRSD